MKQIHKSVLLLLAATFFACADSAPSTPGGGGGNIGGQPPMDAGTSPVRFDRGVNAGPRRLMVIGSPDVFVLTAGMVTLQVAYEENQAPLPMQRVNFRMLDDSGTPAGAAGVEGVRSTVVAHSPITTGSPPFDYASVRQRLRSLLKRPLTVQHLFGGKSPLAMLG